MKLHYLRGRHGGRVATFATATPIANSITEAHVMQRYLRPDLLEAAEVLDFDAWAATFGQTVTEVELSPDGGRFRLKSRFARFHNVPELLRMWHVSGDIKTAEDLQLPTPDLAVRDDGTRAPQTVVIAPTPQLLAYVADLADRADLVAARRVDPDVDNMLKVSGDGRRAALDLRLVDDQPPPGESKVDIAAEQIATIWAQHRDDEFLDATGAPHPVRGSLQIVFCDLSTPNPARWNVYDELREQLVARGVPRAGIRFAHEPRNDQEKGELFAAARTGQVAVLIGSTEKMGVGTNVQARAVALHHLDCPWRPADLQQRDGRILRQGNQHPEVQIIRYVTERSFDAFSWQTVARKAQFIAQVMRGRLDVREITDIGDSALSFNEVKALSTGNPLLLDKAAADSELSRLERLERSHAQARTRLRDTATNHSRTISTLERHIDALQTAIAARRDTRGDQFSMTIAGRTYDGRVDAGHALVQHLLQALHRPGPGTELPGLAELGGLTLSATTTRNHLQHGYAITIDPVVGVPGTTVDGSVAQLAEAKPTGLILRLENRLADLDRSHAQTVASIDQHYDETARALTQADKPFTHADALAQARRKVADLDAALDELVAPPAPPDGHPAADGEPPRTDAAPSVAPHAVSVPDRARAGGAVTAAPPREPRHPAAAAAAVLPSPRPGVSAPSETTRESPPEPRPLPQPVRRDTQPLAQPRGAHRS